MFSESNLLYANAITVAHAKKIKIKNHLKSTTNDEMPNSINYIKCLNLSGQLFTEYGICYRSHHACSLKNESKN